MSHYEVLSCMKLGCAAYDNLADDLKKYGGHTKSCPVSWNKCTCGWDSKLKALDRRGR